MNAGVTTEVRPTRRPPVGMRVLPQRLHYGWWVAIGLSVVMFATIGVGYYGLAIFLRPLQEENGWSNGAVSGATGLYFSVGGLVGFLIGPRIDRHGPLKFITTGIVMICVSTTLLRFVDQLWQLYAVYLLQAVAFGFAGAVGLNSIIARWFITKRAKAISISSTGVSLGGVVMAPVGTWLVGQGGIALAAPVMAAMVLLIALPVAVGVLVWDPADVGLEPDGGAPDPTAHSSALSDGVQRRVWTRAEASRTTAFWAILVAFLLVLMAQTGFVIHQIAFLEDRLGSRSAASFALSITAIGSIVARLVLGQFADRVDKTVLTVGLFVTQGLAVLAVVAIDNRPITYVLVLVIGFTIGNVYMMQSLLVAENFGMVSMGTVYSVIALAAQIGSGFGPFAVGWLEDLTGSYSAPFLVTGGMTLLAAVAVTFARRPEPRGSAEVDMTANDGGEVRTLADRRAEIAEREEV